MSLGRAQFELDCAPFLDLPVSIMTQIIDIYPDATAESVRSLLPRLKGQRVVFSLPDGWAELDNEARLQMLQRRAQRLGIDIALLSTHPETRRAAKRIGIPFFRTTDQALRTQWKMSPVFPLIDPAHPDKGLPDPPHWHRQDIVDRINSPGWRRARRRRIENTEQYRKPAPLWLRWLGNIFMGGVIGVLILGFLLYVLPAATVTLVPGQEPVEVTIALEADPSLDAPDYDAGRLPARLIEKNIDEFGSIATSGSRQKAVDKAQGTVTFTNRTNVPVTIPRGTVVSTSTGTPVKFVTLGRAELPAGVGQRVDVSVEADEPGFDGNVLANTVNTVSGALSFRVGVTNRNGMFGGRAALVAVVTGADQNALLETTRARAEAAALASLQAELEAGEWIPPASVQTFVIAQAFTQFNDEEADELGLNLRLLARGAAISEEQLNAAALNAIESQIPVQGQLVAETLTFDTNPTTAADDTRVGFTVVVRGEYVIPIDPSEVRSLVAGVRPAEAVGLLEQRWQLARVPQIYRDPELLPTLPTLKSRIQVRINYEGTKL